MNNKAHLSPKDFDSNGDIIPMACKEEKGDLISREALKKAINTYDTFACLPNGKLYPTRELKHPEMFVSYIHFDDVIKAIDSASTVEEVEKPFITECRDLAIDENLPLYFVYYEETGVLEVYVTETKELFEKRHCSKHLSDYEFKELVVHYLDNYTETACVNGG